MNLSFAGFFVGLLAMATGCTRTTDRDTVPQDAKESKPPVVVVVTPTVQDYTHDLVLPGTLQAFEAAEIYGQVVGYLDSVSVDIGDTVEAGAVLANIFAPEAGADVQRAQAGLATARMQIKQFEEAKQLADLERERRQTLRTTERGAIAQRDVDVAAAGAEMADAELAAAAASSKRASAELASARARNQFAVVRAPFGGRVTRRYLHPGALVRDTSSSGAKPIVQIQRINPLRVVFDVPETIAMRLAPGHAIEVTYDALARRRDRAIVKRTSGALDPKTRSMRAEADILNDDGALAPGLYASVHLQAMSIPDAVIVPSRVLRGTTSTRHVLVVVDDVVERREVTVATDDGKNAVVSLGLTGTEQVVLAGSVLADEGTTVSVREAD